MNDKIIKELAESLKINTQQVETTLDLLQGDSTVPFIARYRKDATGNLDEEQIEFINLKYKYKVELEKRKEAIIDILQEKGLLTDEIKTAILNAQTKADVENIYEPYKVGKKTKATDAIALGLEPLAKIIFENTDKSFNPFFEARKYINDKVESADFAIEQAKFIIAQWISQDINTRKFVKENIEKYGLIKSTKKTKAEDDQKLYEIYYEFSIPIKYVKDYQVLAINRAENEKIVTYNIDFRKKPITYELNNKYFKVPTTGKIINQSLEDALDRLIFPSIVREIKSDLFAKAEVNAIQLFSNNLEGLLLSPVLKNKRLLSIDPAFVNGCKIAILNENGQLLDKDIFYLTKKNQYDLYAKKIVDLILKHKVNTIVIGNGTASNETQDFIEKLLKASKLNIPVLIVSEVGASVYSASKVAIEEFPDLSVEERSAINIGRRYQDPLNELVKIDPKSLGVGQYQHDLNQKELKEALDFKISKVVNQVGVEINSASSSILSHISGITPTTAQKIVNHINENSQFVDRSQIQKVKGLSKKAYEQAIGFLRISNSPYYFDRTFVHPESYTTANNLVKLVNIDLENIDKEFIKKLDREYLVKELKSSQSEVEMILDSLIEPHRDIRENKYVPIYNPNIKSLSDINVGDQFEGVIKNVADFGIFIYFGIKNNALVHVSAIPQELKNSAKLATENIVLIEISNIDFEKNRVSAKLISFK